MDWLIWTGAGVSALGIAGLIYSILMVAKAKASQLGDDELRERIRKAVPINMGALFVSALGLMLVVLGIALGS